MTELVEKLFELTKTTKRSVDTYVLIYETLDWTMEMAPGRGHLTGQELAKLVYLYSISRYGKLAELVWEELNLKCSEDIGKAVWELVEAGLIGKRDSDSLSDFDGVLTIDDFNKVTTRVISDPADYKKLGIEYLPGINLNEK